MTQKRETTAGRRLSLPTIFMFFIMAWASVIAASAVEGATRQDPDAYMRDLNREFDKNDSSTSDPDVGESSGWVTLGRMFGALALVLGLILLVAWLTRRYARFVGGGVGKGGAARGDTIRIVGTKMLGGRRSLMLVRVRGQTLLLGVTPQSINCLTEIHEIEGEWAQPPENDESQTIATQGSAFRKQFGRFVNQVVADEDSKSS